jgi:16S rRNA processing protein RimM
VEQGARASYLNVAKIARTRGIRGEVLADLHTDFPERFQELKDVWLEFPDGTRRHMTLENSWTHQRRQVLKFLGVDDINAAEEFAGAWVQIEAQEAVILPEGTYFDHDLIGCSVRSLAGDELGTVEQVLRITGNSQLVVRGRSGEFYVPVTEAFCKSVSIDRKEILVDLPQGLIDLNR